MERFGKFIVTNPSKIIFLFIIITLVFLTQIPFITINTSTKSLIKKDAPYRIFYERIKKIFGNEEVVLLVIEDKDIFSYENLVKIKNLTEKIEEIEYVSETRSIINAKHITCSNGLINVKPLFNEIPESDEELLQLKKEALDDNLFVNHLISKDANVIAIAIYIEEMSEEEIYKKRIIEKVTLDIERMIKRTSLKSSIYIGGTPIIRSAASNYMLKDLFKYIPFTALIVMIILFFCFRSPRGVLLPLISLFIVMVWTAGFMNFLGKEINIVTIVVPSLLLAIGCAYTFHFLNQYYLEAEEGKNRSSNEIIIHTIDRIGKPITFIAFTTMVGFGSLCVSKIAPIEEFGISLAVGIFFTLIVTLFFLPTLLTFLKPPSNRPMHEKFEKFLSWLGEMNIKGTKLIIIGSIFIFFISFLGITKLKVEQNNMALFKNKTKAKIDNLMIGKKLSGVNVMSVILEGDEEEQFKDPLILKKVVDLQNFIEGFKEVDITISIADFIRQLNMAMHENDPNFRTIPETKSLVSQYMLLYSNSGGPDDFERYVDYDYKKISITYRVNIYNMDFYLELAEKIKEYASKSFPQNISASVSGSVIITAKTFNEIINTQIESIVIAFVIITVLLFILFKSYKLGIVAMIPNILPILMNFGLMGWLGIRLDLGTSVFAATALGIAVDDTIHFSNRYCDLLGRGYSPKEALIKALQITGFPIVITSITIASGFLVFTLSNFMPIVYLGLIMAWIMFMCLLGDIVLLPVLLKWMSEKNLLFISTQN